MKEWAHIIKSCHLSLSFAATCTLSFSLSHIPIVIYTFSDLHIVYANLSLSSPIHSFTFHTFSCPGLTIVWMENHRDECFTCCILEWTLSQLCMLLRVCITHLISSLLIKIASFYSIIKGVSAMFCEKTETHTNFMTVFILGICFVIGFCFSLLCLIYKLTFIYRKKVYQFQILALSAIIYASLSVQYVYTRGKRGQSWCFSNPQLCDLWIII